MKRLFLAAILLAGLAGPVWAGMSEGAKAYRKGDFARAYREWSVMAEKGHSGAQYLLGTLHEKGKGVKKDKAKALGWYTKAAKKGLASAQYRMGQNYRLGRLVKRDYAQALKWYRMAAKQNYNKALSAIANLHEKGWGVPKDLAKAVHFYGRAGAEGNKFAKKMLTVLKRKHPDLAPQVETALKMRKAADTPTEVRSEEKIFKGIKLVVLFPPPGVKFSTSVVEPSAAFKTLSDALGLIYKKSPANARIIETLKKAGQITISHDPMVPDKKLDMATVRVAHFLPIYHPYLRSARFSDDADGTGATDRKLFPVVVSRHGIKWPVAELAAVLVHELIGHGQQYLEGRIEALPRREIECEARLHQEGAHQDFGLDKSAKKMIDFRKSLLGTGVRDGECSGFKRYLAKHRPDKIKYVEKRDPDIPVLLAQFKHYIKFLETDGVVQRTMAAKVKFREEKSQKIFSQGSSVEIFYRGLAIRDGVGMPPDATKALKFFRRAADKGSAKAQIYLGMIHEEGRGVAKDQARAVKYYRTAAERGNAAAQLRMGLSRMNGSGIAKDPERAYFWLTLAESKSKGKLRKLARKFKNNLAATLASARIAKAQAAAKSWRPKPGAAP